MSDILDNYLRNPGTLAIRVETAATGPQGVRIHTFGVTTCDRCPALIQYEAADSPTMSVEISYERFIEDRLKPAQAHRKGQGMRNLVDETDERYDSLECYEMLDGELVCAQCAEAE